MLVLSRKTHEQIQIGRDVFVTVLEVSGGRVRLGFQAPRDVRICRAELREPTPEPEDASANAECLASVD